MRNKLPFKIAGIISLLFLIGLLPFSFLHANENDLDLAFVTTVYNDHSGLPTGEANTVLQTQNGYIWIGSYGGLIRYDGTDFRNYSLEGAISSSSIRSLYEDSAGRLWIGTNDCGVYVMEHDTFTQIPATEDHSFLCIRDFAEDAEGNIYVASNSGVAAIFENTLVPLATDSLTDTTVYSVATDSYGRLWAALDGGKCAVIQDSLLVTTLESSAFFSSEEIYCVSSLLQAGSDDSTETPAENALYFGTTGNQVAKIVLTSESLDPEDFAVTCYDTGNVSSHNDITPLSSGELLISGYYGFGVLYTDGRFVEFSEQDYATAVNTAILDYEGNIWLASSNHGVIKYTRGYFYSPNRIAGLEDIVVNTIAVQGDYYYLGTDDSALIYDKNWNPVENELTEMLSGIRIRNIMCDSQGRIWLATYATYGAVCYDPSTEEIRTYTEAGGLVSDQTRVIYEMSDGTIAVGTKNGISLIENDEIVRNYTTEDGLNNATILCLSETPDGILLAGSDGDGIYSIDGDTVTNHGFDEGLEEGVVLRMLKNEDGEGFFVSAGSSLYYWENQSFRKLTAWDKDAGSIFDFYDIDGSLWIFQNNGILSVSKEKLLNDQSSKCIFYSFMHGLTGSLNANTWNFLTEDGTLYISTRNGISIFRFEEPSNCTPMGIISSVTVDNELIEHPTEITLPRSAKRMTIHFAPLSYTGTSNYHISYRLKGFDTSEIILTDGTAREISYTNLPGGSYTFCLKIWDPAHPEDARTYEIPIRKEAKLTELPLFWIGVVTLLLLLTTGTLVLSSRVKINRLKKRQQEYKNIVEQSLQTFANTIDAKDPYTNGHSYRVACYSREIAKRMGLDSEEQERIYFVALLHDIGKIGVPDHILNKKDKLTEEEWSIIQKHPVIGGEILSGFTALSGISEGARYHHERYDGTGYCEKKAGEDIPLEARIIGVADSYDAMVSNRCYRKALSTEVVIEELKKGAGSQFDPQIVPIILSMIDDGIVPIPQNK